MKISACAAVLLVLGLSGLPGCSDPPGIVPVAPPGMEINRVPPPTSGSGSERSASAPPDSARNAGPVLSTLVTEPTKVGETKKTNSGMTYTTLREGTGPAAKPGQKVKVNYVGKLTDGTKFDASADHGGPLEFEVGRGAVIKGWEEGIPGMKVGESRRLIIPSDMGYGAKGAPPTIPPNANLVFDVELLDAR